MAPTPHTGVKRQQGNEKNGRRGLTLANFNGCYGDAAKGGNGKEDTHGALNGSVAPPGGAGTGVEHSVSPQKRAGL